MGRFGDKSLEAGELGGDYKLRELWAVGNADWGSGGSKSKLGAGEFNGFGKVGILRVESKNWGLELRVGVQWGLEYLSCGFGIEDLGV